jgi:hypothetical protein
MQHNTLKPLLQLLRFPLVGYHTISSGPSCTLRPCRYHQTSTAHPTRQLTRASLIGQQAIPYRICCGTCCPGVSTPKIQSLADSSTTCHDGINHLHHSNHNIDPHTVNPHLDRWETITLSQRHKPNSTSKWMEDLYDTHDCRAKQYYPDANPNPKGISRYSI